MSVVMVNMSEKTCDGRGSGIQLQQDDSRVSFEMVVSRQLSLEEKVMILMIYLCENKELIHWVRILSLLSGNDSVVVEKQKRTEKKTMS